MPIYSYIAKSLKGEEKKGVVEAKDSQSLAGILKDEGFIPVRIDVVGGEESKVPGGIFKKGFSLFPSVSLTEKMMFTRNLQIMMAAGLPLPRALETLALQSKKKKFKNALLEIKDKVIKGENFSESLKSYPDIFSELFQNMIKVGEESGTMENSLEVLARQMEREHDLKSKIQEAMVYPAVILFAMTGIGILMLIMVVPKLAQTFKELGVELPFTTKIIIGLGTFLANQWYIALPLMLVSGFLIMLFVRNEKVKKIIDSLLLRVPVISSLIRKTNSAFTVRTLSSLITAGVPIVRSLEITAGVVSNSHYKKIILSSVEKVRKGEKLSDSFKSSGGLYPPIVFQMMQVGEETGETSKVLTKLADFFEEEVTSETKNLSSVIEPVLMLIIGGIVGFFAISMIQPMYSMLGAIQ